MKITSTTNPLVKKIVLLKDKSKIRRAENLFVLEGLRELSLALKSNYIIEKILFYEELISEQELLNLTKPSTQLIAISKQVYEKLTYRTTTEGIIALVKPKNLKLADLSFKNKNPIILVAEAPEKPGNIGALLRTADACNIDCVLIANPKTDLYNPNIIRSSVGCLFTNTVTTGNTEEIISFLQQNNINLFAAALHKDAVNYTKQNFNKPTAIIVGTEATGLSEKWLTASKKIIIPMRGKIDSLNVSVAASVLLFEVVRQRNL